MEKINIYRKKLSKSKEIELKQDLIVPDIKQDIFQILDTNFYCYLNKTEVVSGKIKVNGNVDSYISYVSSSEETLGLQANFSFEDVLENNNITDEMNLEYKIEVLKQDIKIINERKISISVNIMVYYEVYGKDELEIFNDFSDIPDVQIDSKNIKMNSLIGINSNIASFKEELKVESSDIISDILNVNTDILNREVKISYNKVLTKADLDVKILYLTKDGRVCKVKEKFPIMSFIDIDNVKEDNICSTDYQIRNILLNVNNGEENGITIQMEYEIICKAFEIKEEKIVNDLYSLKYDTEISSKEIEIEDELSTNNEEKLDINEKIEIENVRNVIEVYGNCKVLKDNEGELYLKIYYESENRIGLNVKNVTIPVIFKASEDKHNARVENLEFDLNNNLLIVHGNIVTEDGENNLKNKTIRVVQDITKKELSDNPDYSMVVYSVKKNDTLWNVAKKFKVKQENIINSNELAEPYMLKYGDKLYIIR